MVEHVNAPRRSVLAVGSHKGGTGRTCSVLALAYAFAERGRRVAIVGHEWSPELKSMMGGTPPTATAWERVRLASVEELGGASADDELWICDTPPVGTVTAQRVLRHTTLLVLTCLADPLSFRTLPTAIASVRSAQASNERLRFAGILVTSLDEDDAVQKATIQRVEASRPELLLPVRIPQDEAVRCWGLEPGSALPSGPAGASYGSLASWLDERLSQKDSEANLPPPRARAASTVRPQVPPPKKLRSAVDRFRELEVLRRVTWCSSCGVSIPSHHVSGGLARRSSTGGFICSQCVRVKR